MFSCMKQNAFWDEQRGIYIAAISKPWQSSSKVLNQTNVNILHTFARTRERKISMIRVPQDKKSEVKC